MNEEGLSNVAYFRIDGGSSKLYTQEYVDKKDKEIERLQRQKEELQVNGLRQETLFKLEIERLNNIINELEKYINEEYIYDELGMKIFDASKLQDKLQELKGSDRG